MNSEFFNKLYFMGTSEVKQNKITQKKWSGGDKLKNSEMYKPVKNLFRRGENDDNSSVWIFILFM